MIRDLETIGAFEWPWAFERPVTDEQFANVVTYGADPTGVIASDAAFALARDTGLRVFVPDGTYKLTTTYTPSIKSDASLIFNTHLIGAGAARVVIQWYGAAGGTMMYSPASAGRLDGFTLDGRGVAANGIVGSGFINGTKPYEADWGTVRIKNVTGIGLYLTTTKTNGSYYSNFGRVSITTCGTGVLIETTDGPPSSNNGLHFDDLQINGCTAIGLSCSFADGVFMDAFRVENATLGVKLRNSNSVKGPNSWIENNVQDFDFDSTSAKFEFNGSIDWSTITPPVLPFSDDRSGLMPYYDSINLGNNRQLTLAGKVRAQLLQADYSTGSPRALRNFQMQAIGLASVSVTNPATTTPSVANASRISLAYTAPTTVTNFLGDGNGLAGGAAAPTAGQLLVVYGANLNGRVQNVAPNYLAGGDWMASAASDTILMEYDPSRVGWVELTRSNPFTSFVIWLIESAGSILGAIRADFANGDTSIHAWKVTGASPASTAIPQVAAGVDFVNGLGVNAASTSSLVLNVADQPVGDLPVSTKVEDTDFGSVLIASPFRASINVNGTTRNRLHIQLKNAATGATVPITSAGLGAGKKVRISVFGRLK